MASSPSLNMQKVLPPGSVLLDVAPGAKPEVMAFVSERLAAAAAVPAEPVEAALLAREAVGSTGVGGGVALPHARLHLLRSTHAVLLRLSEPIDFGAIDDAPVDLVCAIVAPDEPNAYLLTAVSMISRVLRDAEQIEALRSTRDEEEARRILLARD